MSRACAGGWCPIRDRCQRHQQENRWSPIERACQPKQSDQYEPLRAVIPIKEMQ